MKYKAVLFDLDGTLLDTLHDLAGAVNHVMKTYDDPVHSVDDVRRFVGNGIRNLMIRALPKGEEDPKFEEKFSEFKNYYAGHDMDLTKPYPGIMNLISDLRNNGIRLAIVSNKYQPAVTELSRHYFKDAIEVSIGDLEGRNRKPHPDAPNAALLALGLSAKDCLYVGDSGVDAKTAEGVGMDCVLCSWGFRERDLLEKEKSIGIIDKPEDLLEYIN
ncbi:MAG: HAD-IA family hydrolase [Lachnospiraceae bacterium]|nr:HAD-IA family hydrolase [Lachnospiraceae bacterium]